jgi:hypothetical protein
MFVTEKAIIHRLDWRWKSDETEQGERGLLAARPSWVKRASTCGRIEGRPKWACAGGSRSRSYRAKVIVVMELSSLVLVVAGFVLVLGSLAGLTTFGGKRPGIVLTAIFAAFALYILIVLVRIGTVDLSGIGL